jgi:hypothetical protein
MIESRIGKTHFGTNSVELYDGEVLILKAYANSDGTKIRIVIPELRSYKQSLINPDQHFIEVTRAV